MDSYGKMARTQKKNKRVDVKKFSCFYCIAEPPRL